MIIYPGLTQSYFFFAAFLAAFFAGAFTAFLAGAFTAFFAGAAFLAGAAFFTAFLAGAAFLTAFAAFFVAGMGFVPPFFEVD